MKGAARNKKSTASLPRSISNASLPKAIEVASDNMMHQNAEPENLLQSSIFPSRIGWMKNLVDELDVMHLRCVLILG
jgi:hypothetical protein